MLGIDASKAELVTAFFDPQLARFRWEATVPNSPAGYAELLARTPAEVPWVLEPTGRYSLAAAQAAVAAGRTVLLAPSKAAKAYLNSIQTRAKTDRLDSRGLALFAVTRPPTEPLRPYPIPAEPVARVQQLLAARRGITAALTRCQLQQQELPHAAPFLLDLYRELRTHRQLLEQEIAQVISDRATFPRIGRLRTIPGVGPLIAASIGACLASKSFGRADQFVAYIGLDVEIVQSGKRAGTRGLSKQGDAELRRLLYLAAAVNVSKKHPENPFYQQYQRELAKGLSKIAALNAVARKLARTCWSVWHHDTDYDPARVHQAAAPAAAAAPTVECQTVECQTVECQTVECQTVECQTVECQAEGATPEASPSKAGARSGAGTAEEAALAREPAGRGRRRRTPGESSAAPACSDVAPPSRAKSRKKGLDTTA